MGLDMYLNAEKRLNNRSKIDRQYINYFNKLNQIGYTKELHDGDGLYISEYFSTRHINEDLKQLPKIKGQVGEIKSVKSDGDSYIVQTEAGYWRKANQIHDWFVNICQDGVDECQKTWLKPEQLMSLRSLINEIGNSQSKAKLLLPTSSGFFFGSTEYNEYYFDDLRDTKQILKDVLKKATLDNWQLSYQSSW